MEQHIVKIISIDKVTHDVRRYKFEKPAGYKFLPGQATEVSINKPGMEEEKRPFTFTGLNEWDHLEFTIKSYNDHDGVTKKLGKLVPGDELIIRDVWGTINYKGPGVFIAGGAGVTPFIAILRDLANRNLIDGNKLIFANKTRADIILENDFRKILAINFINILSDEKVEGYECGLISEKFLKEYIGGIKNSDGTQKMFYLCGPPPMMDAVEKQLNNLGIDNNFIVKEEF